MSKLFVIIICLGLLNGMSVFAQDNNEKLSYTADLSGYEYPFPVKFFNFESQGTKLSMAYMHLPASEGMETVVLLHGKNFNGAYWQETANYLHELGYGVVMPDQIGFGKSSKPIDYQYSFSALANNTRNLLMRLNIKNPVIVGHSMGGMLASRYTLQYPNQTKRLILVNPIGLENYLQYVEYKDTEFFYENELKQTPDNIIAYQKKNYYDGQWNEKFAALAEPLIGWVQGPDWDKIAKVNALTYDMIFTQPVIEEFKDIKVPTTLILGTRDRTGPGRNWKKQDVTRELGRYDQLGNEVKQRNPDIEIIEMEGLGHLPQIEDFTAFKEIFNSALIK